MKKTTKIPLYVKTYECLFDKIKSGEFKNQLPSETDLSAQLKVSRTTLRQALALLQDDGLIKNLHGIGNFIVDPNDINNTATTLEKISNPLYQTHSETFDDHDISFKLVLDSEYTKDIFHQRSSAVVSCERCYFKKKKSLAFVFTFLPINSIDLLNIDLNDKDSLFNALEHDIYKICTKSDLEIKISNAGTTITQKYKMFDSNQCVLIMETLYKDDKVICHNKFYIPKQFANIKISRK